MEYAEVRRRDYTHMHTELILDVDILMYLSVWCQSDLQEIWFLSMCLFKSQFTEIY